MSELLDRVQAAGFSAAALIPASQPSENFKAFYDRWLQNKPETILPYLNNTQAKYNIEKIFPGTLSVLVALHPYRTTGTEEALRKSRYKIARYAWGRDYHKTLRAKLKKVLTSAGFGQDEFRVVVDSTPLNERYYARLANLGFIGRNGMLIHREYGSFFLLAVALLRRTIPHNGTPTADNIDPRRDIEQDCSSCRLCVTACPTKALRGDGTMSAELCLSTLTIENDSAKLNFPVGTKKHNWIFGCDICQQVCPYNRKFFVSQDASFLPTETARQIAAGVVPTEREALFGTPFLRAGIAGLHRNITAVAALPTALSRENISSSAL